MERRSGSYQAVCELHNATGPVRKYDGSKSLPQSAAYNQAQTDLRNLDCVQTLPEREHALDVKETTGE